MRFRGDPASIRGSIAPVVSPFTARMYEATALALLKKGAPVTEGPVGKVAI